MMGIDDDLLMAFVDGELDEVTRARVERAIAEDPALQARLEVQRRLRARLAAHYAPAAEEEVPERLRSMLETNIVRLQPARAAPPLWQVVTALAATLVLGFFIGERIGAPSGPIGVEDGRMVAQGALADALDAQLASAQPADAPTRIGVTFTHRDGRPCRTFESEAVSGLACHGESGWQLLMTTAGTGPHQSGYRQAASGGALVLQAAQEAMAGEPLEAEAERRARDSGWRRSAASR
jgi:hypothetical protein